MGQERRLTVLGIDGGFASIGYAIAHIGESSETFVEVGVIHTEKSDKKTKVRASDDNVMRARAIYVMLNDIVVRHSPLVAITAEAMSFPRSSSVAAKMALGWGVLAAMSEQLQLPIIQSTPKEVKKALTHNGSSSKEEVMAALIHRYPDQFDRFLASAKKDDLQHGFDAAATVVAGLPSEAIQIARRIIH